ncbi:LOW QUALITY PROTEIN: uncharacterized protein [Atheta coriaria]|uniref:LOW QUALITY PROTEIN: uncharacterized protein n=1 Tax=Dalotia coriaria TaxID=877792 RepID=UPI0031F3AF26
MVLNRTDCEALFAKLNLPKDVRLDSFLLEPFSKEIMGYLGDHLRLTLVTNNGENYTLFVKVVADNKGMLKCFDDLPLYEKELFTYELVEKAAEELSTYQLDTSIVPKLLLTKSTPTGEKVMVFENLQTQGFMASKSHKLTDDEILAGLKALAKYHTISIAWETLGHHDIQKESSAESLHPWFIKSDKTCSGHKYFQATKQGCLELARLLYPDDVELPAKIIASCDSVLDVLNDDNPWRKVLCQGDLWGFNLLFKQNSESGEILAKVIDFQLCRYAPPAHDVTMLLHMATVSSQRKRSLNKFYNHYYQSLKTELTSLGLDIDRILPLDEYEDTCKVYMKVAKFIWLKYRQTSEQSFENAKAMQADFETMVKVVVGSGRPEFIRKLFQIDPPYKKNIAVIFSEFLENVTYHPLPIEDIYLIINKKLTDVYGKIPEYDLVGYCSKEIVNISGYLGNYHKIKLTVKVHCSKKNELLRMKLFAKMLPKTDALKDFHEQTNCGFKECQFFSTIVPHMLSLGLDEVRDCVPTCYLANREGLVFDDLVTEFNYEMGKIRETMPLETVKIGLRALAKLHACGLLLEDKTGKKLPDMYPIEFQETFYNQKEMSKNLLKAGKKGISMGIDLFYASQDKSKNLSPDVEVLKQYACQAIDKFIPLVKPSEKYRNTICHGDLWASNMMFTSGNGKIIDFQSYRYCPCTHDLTQFLHFNMYRADRKRHWQDMLKFYYQEFEKVFVAHGRSVDDFMPYESFLKSAVIDEQFALYQTMTHFQTIMLTSESLQVLFADPVKSRRDLFEDRSQHVKYHWQNDELFRERLAGAIDDVREYYLKH